MSQPTHGYQRSPPRRLTQVRDEVGQTTINVAGLPDIDPFSRPKSFIRGLGNALLATAIFRAWHFIFLFTIEATIVTYFYMKGHKVLSIQSTLMNVLGTVLGFVISYRSSASFDRYNEGRRYWSQVVYNVRMFARAVWFHIPDGPVNGQLGHARNPEEYRVRTLVEKKTVLNLLEAFAVALKHYLRGEEGSYYEDLYPLIKFLPAYALPAGYDFKWPVPRSHKKDRSTQQRNGNKGPLSPQFTESADSLPLPTATRGGRAPSPAIKFTAADDEKATSSTLPSKKVTFDSVHGRDLEANTIYLEPSRQAPALHIFDIWPFYHCIRHMQKGGKQLRGKRALRDRAMNKDASDNVPLEITLYLDSYIAALSQRGADGLATGTMMGALSQMVDALTGLERILSTPVPWAYQVHLWTVTLVWLLVLPFQILDTLSWLTIPGTALAAFVYCGLMKCAEELEDPFGYDYNDLNLDHFTHNIIRKELQALMALPMPDPAKWAFVVDNDAVFDNSGKAIYLHSDDLPLPTDSGKNSWEEDNHLALHTSPVSPLNPRGTAAIGGGIVSPSGIHSFGQPGGAGLIAGAAVAAASISAPDMSSANNNMSNAPTPSM